MQESLRDEHNFIDELAPNRRRSHAGPRSGPLDDRLEMLLCPTDSIHDAVSQLMPFPKIESPPSARIVDLAAIAAVSGEVVVTVNLTTGISIDAAQQFYAQALQNAGVVKQSTFAASTSHSIVRGATAERPITDTSFYVALTETRQGTLVHLRASYDGFDRSKFVDRHANWHHGSAPIVGATVDAVEVATLPAVGRPGHVGRYTTRFRLKDEAIADTRAMVEQRLSRAGWTWIEVTSDELYLDGDFDAELRIRADQADTIVEFVGEFPLGPVGPVDAAYRG